VFAILVIAFAAGARAGVPLHIVKSDLKPLIRAGAKSPTQFAVQVPYTASTANTGTWSVSGDRATWHYAVRIPTAVSLSFHAARARLPASAALTVRGISTTTVYHGKDLHHAELWSRIQPGDTLELALSVSVGERSSTLLEIVSLQAGYRALGAGAVDHPYYSKLVQAVSGTNASCAENYECHVTATNTPSAQATIALVIGNLYQCSGTLINDVPADNAPYVLTARHCENGTLGGGNPGAAASVTVYWDATTACGSTLGAIYDPGTQSQVGATTAVEQQDAWLIRLDDSPAVADAQFAGFDASGGSVQGGYTIHHALGRDKQFTTWSGTAFPVQQSGVLGVPYQSNFWETVNALGNIGPGASGSGLFNQNNRLVGSASLGRKTDDSSGYESCPAPTPPQPNGSNGTADFTSLAAVWNATADNTSSTLPNTLKTILDPANTGTLTVPSTPAASVSFTASTYSLPVGGAVTLTWNAAGATQCTADAGTPGDGWTGTFSAAGSQQVSEAVASIVEYKLSCQLPGGRVVTATLTITWGTPQEQLSFTSTGVVWATRPATLTWTSNVAPCSIFGGAFAVGNLPSSGSITTTQSTTGDVTYQIECGPPNGFITTATIVQYVTPDLKFLANGTDRLLGQPLNLSWLSYADSCTPSGGAPNDGWTTTAFSKPGTFPSFSPNVTTLGTYTYTLICTSGPISIRKDLTITFENTGPFATLSIDKTSEVYSRSAADIVTLTWNSDLFQCVPSAQPLLGGFISNLQPQDTATVGFPGPGTWTFTVTCNPYDTIVGSVTSAPVTVNVLPPPAPTATLSISPTTVAVGQNFVLTWSSTYTADCYGAGNEPPDYAWAPVDTSGSQNGTSRSPGTFTFDLTCRSIVSGFPDATAEATLTVTEPPPTATLTASRPSLVLGEVLNLTWASTNATGCSAGGGGADGTSWAGELAPSGSVSQTTTTAGSFTYTLTCTQGNLSATAQAVVSVKDASVSKGGGGGGAIGTLELVLLVTLHVLRRRACPSRRCQQDRTGNEALLLRVTARANRL
jgi:hypothetical protein